MTKELWSSFHNPILSLPDLNFDMIVIIADIRVQTHCIVLRLVSETYRLYIHGRMSVKMERLSNTSQSRV